MTQMALDDGVNREVQRSDEAVLRSIERASDIAEDRVSVIMPILNEEAHLAHAVAAVLDQDFDGSIELVLALGPSDDETDRVAAGLAAADERVKLVANPSGRTPAGLNAALAVATSAVIVRVDGHCELPSNYLQVALETLRRTDADNVGGVMDAQGRTDTERAIAVAMKSKPGVGGAAFHVGGSEGEALTVYLGAFRASSLAEVGGYDEHFDRAQDWELNHRLRLAGGLIWFNPEMTVTYRPRPTFRRLGRQYFEYGQWRREVMRTYPETVSARYLAPPVLVLGLATGVATAATGVIVRRKALVNLGVLAPLGYAAIAGIGGLAIGVNEARGTRIRVPVALATMHLSWGAGFLTSRRKR